MNIITREPVLTGSLATVLITLVATFGLSLTLEQASALIVAGQVIVGVVARMYVTPTVKVEKQAP